MMKKRNEKYRRWVVKVDRPEEIYKDPSLYYTEEMIEKYARSKAMKRAQEKIAHRIVELLNLEKGVRLLDIGCGVGYTTAVYKLYGYDTVGIDVIPKMLEKAREKGLKVKLGDMRNLQKLFKKESFDAVVSASALQWLKEKEDIEKVAQGINYVLKKDGKVVIQFYPKSEKEMMTVAKIFKKNEFKINIIVDNPNNPKKRTIYVLLNKG